MADKHTAQMRAEFEKWINHYPLWDRYKDSIEVKMAWAAWQAAYATRLEAVRPDGRDAKDAARYRWLRNVADCDMEQPYVVITREYDRGKSYDRLLDGLYLDTAIDAAIAQESGR